MKIEITTEKDINHSIHLSNGSKGKPFYPKSDKKINTPIYVNKLFDLLGNVRHMLVDGLCPDNMIIVPKALHGDDNETVIAATFLNRGPIRISNKDLKQSINSQGKWYFNETILELFTSKPLPNHNIENTNKNVVYIFHKKRTFFNDIERSSFICINNGMPEKFLFVETEEGISLKSIDSDNDGWNYTFERMNNAIKRGNNGWLIDNDLIEMYISQPLILR